ncbi:Ammonium transporter 3 member 1 [Hibiscus syriacus]|uniref:Ammonium transporter 3 member 1 n=1 Tax=Hibiscus syriacus TaxID=106335 RepID=A0A6A2ZLD2_HIBSY|nr:Ammonium transporter 3 member 1 [Hibiscus syriacus]
MDIAYTANESAPSVPPWLNEGDNAWQMTASTIVGIQSMPGLLILYASIVKKKWAVNSAFMDLYAFAAVLICWVLLCYRMAFGDELLPFWGKGAPALGQKYLISRAKCPRAGTGFPTAATRRRSLSFPWLNSAWMAFVPLWLIFSYTVGTFSLWGGGFLYHWGVIDYSGGYVIYLSSGIASLTAAYWVNMNQTIVYSLVVLFIKFRGFYDTGLLLMGWSGLNGVAPYEGNIDASMAVLNTNVCAATSLLVWTSLDVIFFGKPSVIGAVQGMMTGLVCMTPGAGLVQSWAAIVMGMLSGSIRWVTMMILHRKCSWLQQYFTVEVNVMGYPESCFISNISILVNPYERDVNARPFHLFFFLLKVTVYPEQNDQIDPTFGDLTPMWLSLLESCMTFEQYFIMFPIFILQ